MSDVEEKTRVTSILSPLKGELQSRGDCLVTIYSKDAAALVTLKSNIAGFHVSV